MKGLLKAIAAALRALAAAPKWVLERTADGLGWVARLMKYPFAASAPAELGDDAVDAQAAGAEAAKQAADKSDADLGRRCQALRRVAQARVDGVTPATEDLAELPPALVERVVSAPVAFAAALTMGGFAGLKARKAAINGDAPATDADEAPAAEKSDNAKVAYLAYRIRARQTKATEPEETVRRRAA